MRIRLNIGKIRSIRRKGEKNNTHHMLKILKEYVKNDSVLSNELKTNLFKWIKDINRSLVEINVNDKA